MHRLVALLRNSRGVSAAEYALILAVVGSALAVAAYLLGVAISDSINVSRERIENCAGAC